jgi:hypothetical protein
MFYKSVTCSRGLAGLDHGCTGLNLLAEEVVTPLMYILVRWRSFAATLHPLKEGVVRADDNPTRPAIATDSLHFGQSTCYIFFPE